MQNPQKYSRMSGPASADPWVGPGTSTLGISGFIFQLLHSLQTGQAQVGGNLPKLTQQAGGELGLEPRSLGRGIPPEYLHL